jgi:type IV pilus assembly protein PilE
MDIAQRQQQYLLDNRSYASTTTLLGAQVPTRVTSVYTVSIVPAAGPPPSFIAQAAPISGTAQASDVTLTIDQTGARSPADKW